MNFVRDDVNVVPTTRKPFDVLVEGLLVSSIRGDKASIELFSKRVRSLPENVCAAANAFAPILLNHRTLIITDLHQSDRGHFDEAFSACGHPRKEDIRVSGRLRNVSECACDFSRDDFLNDGPLHVGKSRLA